MNDQREYRENKTNLQTTQMKILQTIYPVASRNECTMMILFNLAYPQWVSVNCCTQMLHHIVCMNPVNTGTSNISTVTLEMSCLKDQIRKGQNCYQFEWLNGAVFPTTSKVCSHEVHPVPLKDVNMFSFLFRAISLEVVSIVFIKRFDTEFVEKIQYESVWLNDIKIKKTTVRIKEAKGFIACQMKTEKENHYYGNIFLCKAGELVSGSSVIDEINDCFDQDESQISSDEQCLIKNKRYLKKCTIPSCKCSPLHFKAIGGKCFSYASKSRKNDNNNNAHHNNTHNKIFKCQNGLLIDKKLEKDMVSDCGESA